MWAGLISSAHIIAMWAVARKVNKNRLGHTSSCCLVKQMGGEAAAGPKVKPSTPPTLTHSLGFERVPDVDVEVVVSGKQQASGQGRGQRGDPAHDAGIQVGDELLVGSQVVELTGGIIRACYHRVAVREELEKRGEKLSRSVVKNGILKTETLTPMALMSLSWPPKVCLHVPSRMSHSLAVKSHAPEMKNLKSGDTARDMQSPRCPAKTVFWVPVSISHKTLKEDGPEGNLCQPAPRVKLSRHGCALTRCSLQSW